MNVDFDPDGHAYDGGKTKSVTQIMDAVVPDPFCINEQGARFGSAVHTVVSSDICGGLGDLEYDRAIDPWLAGARLFMRDNPKQLPVLVNERPVIELPMKSAVYGYAGTPDALFRTESPKMRLVDWKTWSSAGKKVLRKAFIQLAAYEQIIRELLKLGSSVKITRTVVWLQENDYRFFDDNQRLSVRFNEFRSIWNVYNIFYGGKNG